MSYPLSSTSVPGLEFTSFRHHHKMMELNISATAKISTTRCSMHIKSKQTNEIAFYVCPNNRARETFKLVCSASGRGRGFGPEPTKKEKTNKVKSPREDTSLGSQTRKSTSKSSSTIPNEIPGVVSPLDGKFSNDIVFDRQFEERLETVRRSALKQRKVEESKQFGTIDYDAPVESEKNTIGLGTKVGVGVAVVVFGLVFALGDFLPSGSLNTEEATMVQNKLTDEKKLTLQTRLQQYEATLSISPKDPTALEGAAVTLSELGEYSRAASLLESLCKEKPSDPDVYRLLGEVKYELKDYEGSAAAYRSSASVYETPNFEVLRGLTNSLLAAKKPNEAVQVLLDARKQLNTGNSNGLDGQAAVDGNLGKEIEKVDPIQVELLLGKAYSDWGHVSDAVSVYDQLISAHPDDFRGYLAKGIILKENGKVGDAERMFIQARFFAPEKAKAFVDRYSR
ncbi:Tetratricopeptide repeat-containing domain [Macleaya cordata]|uniref:Tetratricopeptide repeat-containing domain n=2 Tax=Magnoliopsida TaxID=3398 RepID=A0A200PTZ7_MACCD|nr:Tetratricopeptide repeat-containing domain [Macleaya cordata]